MDVKNRTIRMGGEGAHFIIDEYGIADGAIFHRYVVLSWDLYEMFQKNPDDDMHFDAFLRQHNLDSEWKRVAKDDIGNFPGLLQDTDCENVPAGTAEADEEPKDRTYRTVYDALSEKETLITDPLIMDVFNEAIRGDSDLADWESIFPFFR
ncbi:hypothetical protein GCM10028778_21540 [Barrientosiimonas marina]|uniref:Uncharacterized protein n=1 Tax=Lentibacillus kimchii TaxID=1542911 RepID=A0ABW2UXV9_9BACI